MSDLPAPELELVARLTVRVAAPLEIGAVGAGRRRLIPIIGGELHGPRLHGSVEAAGADFQLVRNDSVAELDARYVLRLADGTAVFVSNRALRRASPEVTERLVRGEAVDPALVYFRCAPSFEVQDGPWRWLAENLFIGSGVRRPDSVEMAFYLVR
ncbi:DUF3237 domain-containing protein [Piscinibacter sakaiensis]|uniref:DUF3237 domain-containing protein n=1 Tax=Piscinibacter sakaiensis TaxID=1547922 RepID=UPI003AAD783D